MVGVTEDGLELSREDIPLIDFWICTTIFDIAAEVSLCHAIEVLDRIEDAGLFGGKSTGFGVENETTFE